jgi:photosystem II stability/assembly factor-like uncharacterized protein
MGDFHDDLRREVERHRLPDGTFEAVSKRRDRRRRNRQVGAVLVAVLVAAGGSFGLLRAFGGPEEPVGQPTVSPSGGPPPSATGSSPGEPSPSPSVTEPPEGALAPAVSGPIQFLDAVHGWAVGLNGEILVTDDGARTWFGQYGGPAKATAVDFIDLSHGWATTDLGLMRTVDAGVHWVKIGEGDLSSVVFLTVDSGWGIERVPQYPENLGRLVQTNDGGATWTEQGQEVSSVCFVDEQTGWAAGPSEAGASAYRTNDGGGSWTEIPVPLPGGDQGWVATIRCTETGAWMLVTGGGAAGHTAFVVFRVDPSGATAVLQEAGTHPIGVGLEIPEAVNPQPGPLVAFDAMSAAVVTSCPPCGGDSASVSFESTSDGGATWDHSTVLGSDPPAEPMGISLIDPSHGWVLLSMQGDKGPEWHVLATTDGGQIWSEP